MSMRKDFGLLILSAVWVTGLACRSNDEKKLTAQEKEYVDRIRKVTQGVDVPIVFFGKVLDDGDRPVPGVEIEAHVAKFAKVPVPWPAGSKRIFVKSNEVGEFKITESSGHSLDIAQFKKSGFDWSVYRDEARRHFTYAKPKGYVEPLFRPESKNPVIFRMRRKGQETFIITPASFNWGQFSRFTKTESGLQKGCDLVKGIYIKEQNFKNPAAEGNTGAILDLIATATLNPKTGAWTFVLSAPEKGGLILSDKLLYEAPADGYQPSLTFTAKLGDPPHAKKYLYFRVRSPWIYGRMSLEGLHVDKDECWIEKQGTVINPYGERNLEAAADLPGDVYLALDKEVNEAFRLGRRPTKPDLAQRMRDWQKSRSWGDKRKDLFKR